MKKLKSFLLVDDDADDALLFKEILENLNAPVAFQHALNGVEAIDLLQKEVYTLPDVIFLDLNMPLMDGKECLVNLKNDERFKHLPVIIYTTSLQSSDIEETIQKGAVCFIAKPTSINDLTRILSFIAENINNNFEKKLNAVSNDFNTFIVC
jgi:CheY-like chemotaxis protein